jgi:fructokinase
MTSVARRLAGVELGGTKAIVVLGEETRIVERVRVPVSDSVETLGAVHEILKAWNAIAPVEALGIASFGPLGVDRGRPDYGRMGATPKPGWEGADLVGSLASAVDGPVAIHTDVSAAALAEGEYGASRGCSDHVYITVGTGIGVGVVANGRALVGQLHPEAGHMRVRRLAGDRFAGVCPFHGDCLEGLAAGPAIAARAGQPGASLADDDPAWEPALDALAEACAILFLVLATERIVIGGGVLNRRHRLIAQVAKLCANKLAGYLPLALEGMPIVPAALGEDAGPTGALLLAKAVAI